MQSDDVLRKRMNRTGNSLHGRLGRQRRRMGDRTVGRAGRIEPRSLAVSGYAGHRPLRFFLGAFRLDAQIESGIAAVAQIGKKMFQHVSVRLSPLQIHQPLFPPVDDLALGVVYPYGRTIENIQHLAAVGNVGSGDPFPKHPPCDALGMVLVLGMPLADAAKSMATATGVKGRVEVVPTDTDYTVLIDYAHSPDGVENVLKAVRGFAKGRVVALFGCGGDRDRTKRPKMGRIAADLADFCIVTSDNPRTEEPKAIIDDILEGMKDSKTPMQVIVDRPAAIHWALEHAQKDDIIVLMGKGHETYQEVNHVKHHMDEREIVAEYFNK